MTHLEHKAKGAVLLNRIYDLCAHLENTEPLFKLINDYGEQCYLEGKSEANKIDSINIIDKIEPYLNENVKRLIRNRIETPIANIAHLGVTIIRNMQDSLNGIEDVVFEPEYKAFADILNTAQSLGLIETGCYMGPVSIKLAVISPQNRTCLLASFNTEKTMQQLRQISNSFLHEGELPPCLNDIAWNTL